MVCSRSFFAVFSAVFVLLSLSSLLPAQSGPAKPLKFDITAAKKRLDVERKVGTSTTATAEKWIYTVTIRNNTFAAQTDLVVQYRVYMKDDRPGKVTSSAKTPLREEVGEVKIDALANPGSYVFTTKEVLLEAEQLNGNWYYANGDKRKVKDTLYGIWIRILKDGYAVSEYINPPALRGKAEWN